MKRAPSAKYVPPDGWVARGFAFEVEWPAGEQAARIWSRFGARRKADNWALGQVKANIDARLRRAGPARRQHRLACY